MEQHQCYPPPQAHNHLKPDRNQGEEPQGNSTAMLFTLTHWQSGTVGQSHLKQSLRHSGIRRKWLPSFFPSFQEQGGKNLMAWLGARILEMFPS